MTENYIKVDLKSFQDICKKVETLEKENEFLQTKLDLKERIVNGLKLNNGKLTLERNKLQQELDQIKGMSMFEFGNTYCSAKSLEDDGHAFARSLLGHRMTDDEVAIEAAENRHDIYKGDDF